MTARHYVRFGTLPEGGRSEHQNWPEPWHCEAASADADTACECDDDLDWQDAYAVALEALRWEAGVSVYDAVLVDAERQVYMLTGSAHALAYARTLAATRPAYLVDGTLAGTGTDGEPCITGATIVTTLNRDQIQIA